MAKVFILLGVIVLVALGTLAWFNQDWLLKKRLVARSEYSACLVEAA
jgi:hypothetical protein